MADHPRQVIRKKVQEKIINAGTSFGTRVYTNRIIPVQQPTMPICLIYITNEPTSRDRELPYKRQPSILIEVLEKTGPDLDDKLDALCREIEMVFQHDEFLDNLTNEFFISSTDIRIVEEGGTKLGSAVITYSASYYTRVLT
jgi:hypothetical protein